MFASALQFGINLGQITVKKTAGDVVMVNEGVAVVNKTSGAATQVTLPPSPGAGGLSPMRWVVDGKGDAASNNITVIGASSATIDGASSYVISNNYGAVLFLWNGTEWNVLGAYNATGGTFSSLTATNATITNLTTTNSTLPSATITNASLSGTLTTSNGAIVAGGVGSGLTFMSAANQKLGLWGATPIVQPAGTSELIGIVGNSATAANATNMTSNGNTGSAAYSLNDVVKAIKKVGLLAS